MPKDITAFYHCNRLNKLSGPVSRANPVNLDNWLKINYANRFSLHSVQV